MAIIADESALTRIKEHKSKIHTINHDGCEHCRWKGTKGRKLVLEYTVVDDTARKFIYNGDSVAWVESLHKRGWKSMADSSWDFILSGNFDAEIAETEVPGVLASSMEWQY
jgi:type II secretory ATPase GspE/PulE/Tfp pilus assembly ATPase PilB-like protein